MLPTFDKRFVRRFILPFRASPSFRAPKNLVFRGNEGPRSAFCAGIYDLLHQRPLLGQDFTTKSRAWPDNGPMASAQGNLKSTIVVSSSDSLPVLSDLPGESLHQLREDQALQLLSQVSKDVAPVRHRPQLFLSFLPVKFMISASTQSSTFESSKISRYNSWKM